MSGVRTILNKSRPPLDSPHLRDFARNLLNSGNYAGARQPPTHGKAHSRTTGKSQIFFN